MNDWRMLSKQIRWHAADRTEWATTAPELPGFYERLYTPRPILSTHWGLHVMADYWDGGRWEASPFKNIPWRGLVENPAVAAAGVRTLSARDFY